jgi:hypothetical protein
MPTHSQRGRREQKTLYEHPNLHLLYPVPSGTKRMDEVMPMTGHMQAEWHLVEVDVVHGHPLLQSAPVVSSA